MVRRGSAAAPQTHGLAGDPPPIRASQSAAGCWIVADHSGQRGGMFRDVASLMRFVRREFGKGAEAGLTLGPPPRGA